MLELECVSNLYVKADISKFSQVLRNLISNALKFTPAGGSISVTADILIKDEKRNDTFNLLSEGNTEKSADLTVSDVSSKKINLKSTVINDTSSSKSVYKSQKSNQQEAYVINTLETLTIESSKGDQLLIPNPCPTVEPKHSQRFVQRARRTSTSFKIFEKLKL